MDMPLPFKRNCVPDWVPGLIEILARDGEGDARSLQVLTPSSRMVLEVSPPDRLRAAFADPVRVDLVSDLLDS